MFIEKSSGYGHDRTAWQTGLIVYEYKRSIVALPTAISSIGLQHWPDAGDRTTRQAVGPAL
jgi:hypothetical protein